MTPNPKDECLPISEIMSLALTTGFMIHSGYGQQIDKKMPVSDTETLRDFANAIIRAWNHKRSE